MIDSVVALAFAVHANPSAYALLLGSGVARAAGVPTGWEVLTGLIEKVAHLEGEDTAGDPAAWFQGKYKAEPSYSKVPFARDPRVRRSHRDRQRQVR